MSEGNRNIEKYSKAIRILRWIGRLCIAIGVLGPIILFFISYISYLINPLPWKDPSTLSPFETSVVTFIFFGLPLITLGIILILIQRILKKPSLIIKIKNVVEKNKLIVKNASLAVLYCWILVLIWRFSLFIISSPSLGFGRGMERIIPSLFATFSFIPFDIIILISIFVGFCLGLKFFYKNKYKFLFFVLPLISGFFGSFVVLMLALAGGGGIAVAFALAGVIVFVAPPYLFSTLIISSVFYLRKERF